MKKYILILLFLFVMVSCKEPYQMPNYFKHNENGNVKQITIQTYEVKNGAMFPYPGNYIVIWSEISNGTLSFDKNGNILSDVNFDYFYDEDGRLNHTISKDESRRLDNIIYNELDEIYKWGEKTFRYTNDNQICTIIEEYKPTTYYPGSYREYEYTDNGKMKNCNFNHNKSIYSSEYNDKGELKRHVQLMENGRVQEYNVNITHYDNNGNWIERRIEGTNYNGLHVEFLQKRTLRYY